MADKVHTELTRPAKDRSDNVTLDITIKEALELFTIVSNWSKKTSTYSTLCANIEKNIIYSLKNRHEI